MLTTIPFTGFYETLHDDALDQAFDMMLSDDSGDAIPGISDHAWRHVNFGHAHKEYAKAYAKAFAEHIGAALTFESMKSPREYNFGTDVIYCELTTEELTRLTASLPAGALAAKATEHFTSRDGFMSFYSPDVEDWGDVAKWDHNQAGTVLECVADMHAKGETWDQWDEFGLTEDLNGNGYLDNWIIEGSPSEFLRVVNIAGYLRRRAERAFA